MSNQPLIVTIPAIIVVLAMIFAVFVQTEPIEIQGDQNYLSLYQDTISTQIQLLNEKNVSNDIVEIEISKELFEEFNEFTPDIVLKIEEELDIKIPANVEISFETKNILGEESSYLVLKKKNTEVFQVLNETEIVEEDNSCVGPDGATIENNWGKRYYEVEEGYVCPTQYRVCYDGELTGSYEFASCNKLEREKEEPVVETRRRSGGGGGGGGGSSSSNSNSNTVVTPIINDTNSTDLNSTNLNSTDLNSTDLNSTDLNSTELNSTDLNSTNLNSTDLNSTDLNSTDLNSTDLNSTDLNSTDLNSTDLNSTDLNSTDLNETNSTNITLKKLWSDPDTWESGEVPKEGDDVEIPKDEVVYMDVSEMPYLKSITIRGTLRSYNDTDIYLNVSTMRILGSGALFEIGNISEPYTGRALITMITNHDMTSSNRMNKGIMVMSGAAISLNGEEKTTWTTLDRDLEAGDGTITLSERPVNWKVGDRLVIASTSNDPSETEEVTISGFIGERSVFIYPDLSFDHSGSFDGNIDKRAEVGNLDKNIELRGDDYSDTNRRGAHIMVMEGSEGRYSNTEFTKMGLAGVLGTYPIHYHLTLDSGDSYVYDNSIHDNYQRCVTIHNTFDLEVRDNLCYKTFGHGYFLEDSVETGNELIRNLALNIEEAYDKDKLIYSDDFPTGFWISNPDNTFINNVAAAGVAHGFTLAFANKTFGPSFDPDVTPNDLELKEFDGNKAHSNLLNGFHMETNTLDSLHNEDLDGSEIPVIHNYAPTEEGSDVLDTSYTDFVAYSNNGYGIFARGDKLNFVDVLLDGNAFGINIISTINSSFLNDTFIDGVEFDVEICTGNYSSSGNSTC